MKRIPYPNYIRRTGAVFESTEAFLDNTAVVKTNDQKFDYCGVVLTQVSAEERTIATAKEEFHSFVLGETGSGKTRRVILPTIRLLAKSGRSILTDQPSSSSISFFSRPSAILSSRNVAASSAASLIPIHVHHRGVCEDSPPQGNGHIRLCDDGVFRLILEIGAFPVFKIPDFHPEDDIADTGIFRHSVS